MAELQRWSTRINLGASSSLGRVAGVLDDFALICTAAGELQRFADRNDAVAYLLRQPSVDLFESLDDEFDAIWRLGRRGPWPVVFPIGLLESSPALVAAVEERLNRLETEEDAAVRVQSLTYQNPLELVILASGVVVVAVLRFLRDLPARRRLNDIAVDDYRNRTEDARELRRLLLRQLANGEHRLTAKQIERVMTPDVLDAMQALADADIQVRQLPGPDESSD